MTDDPEALAGIKASLAEARDLEVFIAQGEERLARAKLELFKLEHEILPSRFNAAGVRTLSLEADGNMPAYMCKLRPYYKAVIPAKWDDQRRAEALAELAVHGAEDLAKKVVSVSFPRSEAMECEALCQLLSDSGYSYNVSFEIHHATLTSWLKETVEGGTMPDLEKIGGQVGQVVNLKIMEE